jgi:hypothetical protein
MKKIFQEIKNTATTVSVYILALNICVVFPFFLLVGQIFQIKYKLNFKVVYITCIS